MRRLGRLSSAARRLSTFYDSQSGKHVTLPTGPQISVGLTTVPSDRVSSALAHLKKDGKPCKGLASVLTAVVQDEAGVFAAAESGHTDVCIEVSSSVADGVAAVKAAIQRDMRPLALLSPEWCADAL